MFFKHSKIPSNLYTYEIVTNHQQKQKRRITPINNLHSSFQSISCYVEKNLNTF